MYSIVPTPFFPRFHKESRIAARFLLKELVAAGQDIPARAKPGTVDGVCLLKIIISYQNLALKMSVIDDPPCQGTFFFCALQPPALALFIPP